MTSWDRLFLALFAAFSLAQLALLLGSPLDLSGDELHYVLWSERLDFCFYSKGPLLALLIRASTELFGDAAWAVRLPAALCYSAFSLLFYVFLRKEYGSQLALGMWLLLRSSLAFAQTGFLMTSDAPLLLFWFIALWAGSTAITSKRERYWLLFGLAVGLAIWSKYTAIFLLPSALFAAYHLGAAKQFKHKLLLLGGVLVCALSTLPILYWNSQHQWVNFAHNAGHLLKDNSVMIRPKYFFELLLGQFGLLGPLLFVAVIAAFWFAIAQYSNISARAKYYLCLSLPLAAFVLGISLTKRVYANWPLPIYVGALLLLTDLFSSRVPQIRKLRGLYLPALALNLLLLSLAHLPLLGFTLYIPGEYLPTKKLVAWSELGRTVSSILDNESDTPIITDKYWTASAIPYYSEHQGEVYLSNLSDRRMTQFDIWQTGKQWQALAGQDALLILNDPNRLAKISGHFQFIKPEADIPKLEVRYSGTAVRSFYFYRGINYDGWVPPPARR